MTIGDCLAQGGITIGVIAPYRGQMNALKDLVNAQIYQDPRIDQRLKDNIAVNTVDSFQGAERDLIIFSFTRANPSGNLGFLGSDLRRMNVMLTR